MSDVLTETTPALPAWLEDQLCSPPDEGHGRNDFVIKLAPRLIELGWNDGAILEAFKESFGLQDDHSKDDEIQRTIHNAHRYAGLTPGSQTTTLWREEKKRCAKIKRDTQRELAAALDGNRFRGSLDQLYGAGWHRLPAEEQTVRFISALFEPDDVIWIGNKQHSGKPRHCAHFKAAADWIKSRRSFPFVSQCTFQEGTYSRAGQNVFDDAYMIVESDHLEHEEVVRIFLWLWEEKGLPLRAVVHSGNKSLHGWFDRPDWPQKELEAFIEGLGCDPATVRPVQPVRLPGVERLDTGRLQTLLYLDESWS